MDHLLLQARLRSLRRLLGVRRAEDPRQFGDVGEESSVELRAERVEDLCDRRCEVARERSLRLLIIDSMVNLHFD